MRHKYFRCLIIFILILCMMPAATVYAWTDQGHMAAALAAGYTCFQNCVAPDISHTVAQINNLSQTDGQAHFFNAPDDYVLTIDDAYHQLQSIGQSRGECPEGYLLGAILQTVRMCKEKTAAGTYDEEYYAVLLHYVGDLAEPLHMTIYDDFNRSHHLACDDVLSDKDAKYPVFAAVELADKLTVDNEAFFETEEQMVEAVVDLAKQSQEMAIILRSEQRNLTREEALLQLSRAATLGRAIMKYCGKIERNDQFTVPSLKQDLTTGNSYQSVNRVEVQNFLLAGLLLAAAVIGIIVLKKKER